MSIILRIVNKYLTKVLTLALLLMAFPSSSYAEGLSAYEVVARVEKLLWGKTMQGDMEMTIVTPRWQRTMALKVWMDRPTKTFVRITTPAKEAGIGSLRIANEMWNYLPSVERTIKIPPSMMLQPWMGSDFTNDDLVKESSVVEDYNHKFIGSESVAGETAYQIESVPKPEAAVVWGKIIFVVRKDDLMPITESFYSERGELVRVLSFSDVRIVDGRKLPTRWEMRPLTKPNNRTTMVLKDARFDRPIDPEIFSQRNLQKPSR